MHFIFNTHNIQIFFKEINNSPRTLFYQSCFFVVVVFVCLNLWADTVAMLNVSQNPIKNLKFKMQNSNVRQCKQIKTILLKSIMSVTALYGNKVCYKFLDFRNLRRTLSSWEVTGEMKPNVDVSETFQEAIIRGLHQSSH